MNKGNGSTVEEVKNKDKEFEQIISPVIATVFIIIQSQKTLVLA